MDKKDLLPGPAGDTASTRRTTENWIRLEKQYKETINTQNGILQYVIKEYQEKVADLEKERDSRKKTAEEERESLTRLLIQMEQCLLSEKNTVTQLQKKQAQLEEELAELKRQETLVECKICFERPVQNVFPCGHAACDECYQRILKMDTAGLVTKPMTRCHLCRMKVKPNAQKIFLS